MRYREASFYGFGLKSGLRSFLRNGFRPGFRVASSAVFQPVTSYTRFPEFHFIEGRIAALSREAAGPPPSVLDLGSPKLLGLYLAYHRRLDVWMTDLDESNVEPYALVWKAIARGAKGTARFEPLDARRIALPDGRFEAVFSLSVLEHVEGPGQDGRAVEEMVRVLKPGGWLLLSVPFGPRAEEQWARGIAHAGRRTRPSEIHFFQRIYDRALFETRILGPLSGLTEEAEVVTAYRRPTAALRVAHFFRGSLPEGVVAAAGALNPLLSLVLNRHRRGFVQDVPARFGRSHRFGDIFADLIVAARKKGRGMEAAG